MNINLQKNQITRLASNNDVFRQGVKLYNNKAVSGISFSGNNLFNTAEAEVRDDGEVYHTKTVFTHSGALTRYSCTCNANTIWKGSCDHIIAALFYILDVYEKESESIINQRMSKELLEHFRKQAITETELMTHNARTTAVHSAKIKLVPKFTISDNSNVEITLTIGTSKMYVVKSISELIYNIQHKRTVTYGKNLELTHDISLFDDEAKELIEFISIATEGVYNHRYGYASDKFLRLTARAVDSFFNLYMNKEVEGNIMEQINGSIFVTDEKLPLKFELLKQGEMIILRCEISHFAFFMGYRFGYIYLNNRLYRMETDLYDCIFPIFKIFIRLQDSEIKFSKQDMKYFMFYLMPELKRHGLLEIDEDYLSDFTNDYVEIKPKIYLDMPDSDLLATVSFFYGDYEVNPLADRDVPAYINDMRNTLHEKRVVNSLLQNGFLADHDTLSYRISDTDRIYNFFYNDDGVESLKKYAEILISDDFTKKSTKVSTKTAIGLRYKGELLNVHVDTHGYDLDELYAIMESLKKKKSYHRLKSGRFVNLKQDSEEMSGLMQTAEVLNGLGLSSEELAKNKLKTNEFGIKPYRSIALDELTVSAKTFELKTDEKVKTATAQFKNYSDTEFKIPDELDSIMRNYQKEGFSWLKLIAANKFGGILADDMGLGKTLQIISLILSEKQETGNPTPSIVISPTSLVYSWEREINRFATELVPCTLAAGQTSKDRKDMLKRTDVDIYITSYDILKRDLEIFSEAHDYRFIIADEAQYMKNPGTQNAKAVKSLTGDIRYALTGTPIENSLMELWSIFDFVMPGYLFNSHKFTRFYESPIVKESDKDKAVLLRKQISPFILRRIKKDVLTELPDKIDSTQYSEMYPEQKQLYTAHLLSAKNELESAVRRDALKTSKIQILAMITRLRQICCHPSMFIKGYSGGSGKLDYATEIIHNATESGHRLLIFSQFTSMLSIIETRLEKEKIEYFYLDGAIDPKSRVDMAERFNNGERSVFLISLKAGGTGLNLTGADMVIHFDPWWNPAVMNQATDRAHRFGQDKVVEVINLVAKDSIEEKILALCQKKKELVDNVITIDESSGFLKSMSEEELIDLFKIN